MTDADDPIERLVAMGFRVLREMESGTRPKRADDAIRVAAAVLGAMALDARGRPDAPIAAYVEAYHRMCERLDTFDAGRN